MTLQPPQPPILKDNEPILGQVFDLDTPAELEPLPPLPPANGKCNARRKNRTYCQAPSMRNGRCHKHGGATPVGVAHHSFRHGQTSKSNYLPPTLGARMERINGDALDNLEESIGIQKVLETQIHERLKTGESGVLWGQLSTIVSLTQQQLLNPPPPPDGMDEDEAREWLEQWSMRVEATAFDEVSGIIREGAKAYAVQKELRKDIQSIHDSQRKLTETLTKSRKEIQETYTQEQWSEMLNRVLLAARRVMTQDQLVRFSDELEGMKAAAPKQLNP